MPDDNPRSDSSSSGAMFARFAEPTGEAQALKSQQQPQAMRVGSGGSGGADARA